MVAAVGRGARGCACWIWHLQRSTQALTVSYLTLPDSACALISLATC